MCFMKMNRYEDALIYCDLALEIDKEHVKSLYRRGQCLTYLFDFEGALKCFKKTNFMPAQGTFVRQIQD